MSNTVEHTVCIQGPMLHLRADGAYCGCIDCCEAEHLSHLSPPCIEMLTWWGEMQGDLIGGFIAFFVELAAMKDSNVKEGVLASGRPFVATLSLFCILVLLLFKPHS